MKLNAIMIGSHLATAVACAMAWWGTLNWGVPSGAAVGVALGTVAGVSWLMSRALLSQLSRIEAAVKQDASAPPALFLMSEFEEAAQRASGYVTRWSEAATRARQDVREAEVLVARLDVRGQSRSASGSPLAQLNTLLSNLVDTLQVDLSQLDCDSQELDAKLAAFASGTSDQAEAVSRTTTYVEQLTDQFEAVSATSNAAQQSVHSVQETTQRTHDRIAEQTSRIDQLRTRMESTVRKLVALKERSQAIGAIVENIGAVSSKTDMLAFNASIESLRAGEEGRGFSVVAEEVRKLAEQSAQSTREISTLIEAIQAEVDEAATVMTDQQREMAEEAAQLSQTGQQVSNIQATCSETETRIRDVARVAAQQLNLTQSLVSAVERISETNRLFRTQIEEAGWTTRSIVKSVAGLGGALEPLWDADAQSERPQHSARGGRGDVRPTNGSPGSRIDVDEVHQHLAAGDSVTSAAGG